MTIFRKKEKNPLHQLLFKAGAVGVLVLAVALLVADVRISKDKSLLNQRIAQLQQQIASVKNQNADLEQGISQANNDAYIEKVAREELDMQKPGETVVSFVAPKNPSANNVSNQQQNWLSAIWTWIKSKF